VELKTEASPQGTPSELGRLASFVGRLYLLLATIVYDHSRWLPKDLRDDYKAALAEVYPSVWRLQTELLDLDARDDASAARRKRRLQQAGLTGAQLDVKLAAYDHAEARFYGTKVGSPYRPDRRFTGEGESWLAPPPEEGTVRIVIEDVTEGGKLAKSRAFAQQAGPPANTLLGTLLSVFSAAESYKEIKEGIEWALENGKLIVRGLNWIRGRVIALRNIPLRRRAPEPIA
jgi:hypothetical protein